MNQKIKLPEITTEERHWIVERPQPEVPFTPPRNQSASR